MGQETIVIFSGTKRKVLKPHFSVTWKFIVKIHPQIVIGFIYFFPIRRKVYDPTANVEVAYYTCESFKYNVGNCRRCSSHL